MAFTARAARARAARSGPPKNEKGRKQCPPRIRAIRPPRPATDRRAALSRVLGLWPHELDDETATGRQQILAKLKRALRAERRRGVTGHWTYDLARHIELLHLYRQELAVAKVRSNEKAAMSAVGR